MYQTIVENSSETYSAFVRRARKAAVTIPEWEWRSGLPVTKSMNEKAANSKSSKPTRSARHRAGRNSSEFSRAIAAVSGWLKD